MCILNWLLKLVCVYFCFMFAYQDETKELSVGNLCAAFESSIFVVFSLGRCVTIGW